MVSSTDPNFHEYSYAPLSLRITLNEQEAQYLGEERNIYTLYVPDIYTVVRLAQIH